MSADVGRGMSGGARVCRPRSKDAPSPAEIFIDKIITGYTVQHYKHSISTISIADIVFYKKCGN
jgi:hypothetical protein